jgi:hypothetical protein
MEKPLTSLSLVDLDIRVQSRQPFQAVYDQRRRVVQYVFGGHLGMCCVYLGLRSVEVDLSLLCTSYSIFLAMRLCKLKLAVFGQTTKAIETTRMILY